MSPSSRLHSRTQFCENNTLWVSSLLAMPPPAPGTQSLAGLMTVDLPGSSLTQWATHIQDITSGMRMPPEAVVNCPQEDIVGVLKPAREDDPGEILSPLLQSRVLQCTSPDSQSGISLVDTPNDEPPLRYPPPGLPPLEPAPMDMLPAPTSENLLANAGVGRGGRGLRQPRTPTAPGLHQMRPTAPPQWMPTPGRQEASQATPYQQQVYLPQHTTEVQTTTTKPSTAPSTSQDHNEMARGSEDPRGRSSSRGPQGRNRRDRSSTKGSRKC